MSKIYRTARGKQIDMAALIAKHEKTRAVSNKGSVNARGDEIDSYGRVVRPVNDKVAENYAKQVKNQTAQPRKDYPTVSPSANPNAPLSPKQKRELEAQKAQTKVETPLLDQLVEKSQPKEEFVAPIEEEIAPFPVLEPQVIEFEDATTTSIDDAIEYKSADEAPDSFPPTNAVDATLTEEDFVDDEEEALDIEAIKAACLENVVSEPEPETKVVKSKKKRSS